jgi:hypothetical protein
VSSLVFAPAGPPTLATAGISGAVILWDLVGLNQTRDHLVQRTCELTGGGLSRDEWSRHVASLPFGETCSGP